ncbi:MAG: DUF4249 domain-containing protein [Saprospiraceae bacterium]|nr:DUF4249 domain-containing protein [Saprospiraceae bacterium]
MKFHVFTWMVFSSMFFTSCEEEVYFANAGFKPRIVLSSIFTNDSAWVVTLTHSQSAFEATDTAAFIEDAKIVITNKAGAQECVLNHVGRGVYKSYRCTSGQDEYYKISIYSEKYGSVSAESTIPARAEVTDILISNSAEIKDASEISFNIKDNSTESNFYIWSIVEVDTTIHIIDENNSLKLDLNQWVNDVRKESSLGASVKLNTSLSATDRDLENATSSPKVITSKFLGNGGQGTSNPGSGKEVLMLRLMTVSSDLYNYYQSLQKHVKASQDQNSVYDPGKLYSNVKGGLGIFAGYSVQFYPLKK